MAKTRSSMPSRREVVLTSGATVLGAAAVAPNALGAAGPNPTSPPATASAGAQAVPGAPSAGSWAAQKKRVGVLDRSMTLIERGAGTAVVFLHGNPTSSFLWRNVLEHAEAPGRRLIVPDLIGMGDSDKLPATVPDRYRFACHARYLDAFLASVLAPREPVVLVLHDWGGALGFDWARRHPDRLLGIAYSETFLRPLVLADLPESFHPTLKAVRSDEGRRLVLDENMFIERMLPGVTQRVLTEAEMAEYRRPYLAPGEDRLPTLQWPREVPLSGEPADVAERMEAYGAWLRASPVPKLFIDADPGVFVTGSIRDLARSLPNQRTVTVSGLHFVQEDSPEAVGRALADWLPTIPA